MDVMGITVDDEPDDTAIRRLVQVAIERGTMDAWTAPALAIRLGLPTLQVRRALRELTELGLVVYEVGEYRSADVA